MATVGFGEIYRYGTNFFAYVLFVAGLALVFLAGGAYLASRAMTLTDPSLSALSQPAAIGGLALGAVGVVVGTIGTYGLWYKLLTESMGRALAARAVAEEEEGSDGTEESADTAGPAAADAERDAEPERRDTGGRERTAQGPATEVSDPATAARADEPAEVGSHSGDADPQPTDAAAPGDGAETSAAEWTPPDPDEIEAGGTAEQEAEGDVDPETEDDPDSGDAVAEDGTLADEDVESFDPAAEDDPLEDRMPSDEE